jgi:S1-C subfamily serine protease
MNRSILALLCATLFALAPVVARADDAQDQRDRKARAALALAATARPTIATAPAPRVAVPKDYPTGYRVATAEAKPLVVFVGPADVQAVPVPGAIVAKADDLPGVKAPAAVVAYPVNGKLYVHETLPADKLDPAKLVASVKAATKKVEVAPAPDKLAPKPLDWDVRAEPPAAIPACACGDVCPCSGKTAKATDPRDSLVRVRKGGAQGSGTVVHSGQGWSLVLTAAHVVDGPGALTVRGNGTTYPAQVIDSDTAADLAAVLVPADLPAVKVSETDPADGTEVLLIGMTSIVSRPKLSGRDTLSGREVLLYGTEADSDSGDSGAGVFVKGELVGVHCGKVHSGPGAKGTPHATATGPVRKFLARVLGKGVTAAPKSVEQPKAESPKATPAAPKVTALQPGDLVTVSGTVIRPVGRGTYAYVGDAPASSCPGGKCPLQK